MRQRQLSASDGAALTLFRWSPQGAPRAVVQLAHGASEHLGRYARLAAALSRAGYEVVGADHRGHGTNALHGAGDFGPGGFAQVVADLRAVASAARADAPGKPLILLGHSMGSFAAQAALADNADLLDGVVLSGTAAIDELMASGDMAASLEACNAAFEPARTPFDWLSRDPAEVDAYMADPRCGGELQLAAVATMPGVLAGVRGPERLAAAVARQIPIYLITGSADPIAGAERFGAEKVAADYRAAGFRDVEHRVYPEGRHEMFNETNRNEVTADLASWLDARF